MFSSKEAKDLKEKIEAQERLIEQQDVLAKQQSQIISLLQESLSEKKDKLKGLNVELNMTKIRIEALRSTFSTLGFDVNKIELQQDDIWTRRGLEFLKLMLESSKYDATYNHDLHDAFSLPGQHDSVTAKDNLGFTQLAAESVAPFLKGKLVTDTH